MKAKNIILLFAAVAAVFLFFFKKKATYLQSTDGAEVFTINPNLDTAKTSTQLGISKADHEYLGHQALSGYNSIAKRGGFFKR